MLEEEYEKLEDIPSKYRHLYAKVGDKYVLLSEGQVKTQDDIDRIQEGLRKEREDHKGTKDKLNKFNGLDPEEVHQKLDRYDELEAAAAGKIDDAKINEMVETRIKSRTAPLEREITNLKTAKTELEGKITDFETKDTRRTIHDHIRKAATEAKVRDTAVDDALLVGENIFRVDETGRVVTKDNVGVTPGIEPSVWLTEAKNTRPHWWPESQGTGARGGKGDGNFASNPFTAEGWNLTEQGKLVSADRSRAEQMAKAAGTTIGGGKPVAKK